MEPWPDYPVEVVQRRTRPLSPWLQIDEIEVRMPGSAGVETYHGLRQADAAMVLAMTADFQFLIVRQYRPVIEAWTWELPAGCVDPGEDPAAAAARELTEETGYRVGRMIPLGALHEDPPRRTNRIYDFFALLESGPSAPEAGMAPRLVSGGQLKAMALAGELAVPSQVALLFRAACNADVQQFLRGLGLQSPPWI